jgi:hypothetical protein
MSKIFVVRLALMKIYFSFLENPKCKDPLDNYIKILNTGACSREKVSSFIDGQLGFAITAARKIICQKTSDNNGYCAVSQMKEIKPYLENAPFDFKPVICTDCVKNQLDAILAILNRPANFTTPLTSLSANVNQLCGDSLAIVSGNASVSNSTTVSGSTTVSSSTTVSGSGIYLSTAFSITISSAVMISMTMLHYIL